MSVQNLDALCKELPFVCDHFDVPMCLTCLVSRVHMYLEGQTESILVIMQRYLLSGQICVLYVLYVWEGEE